jgi:lysyl-tRNA synthetase class I
MFNINDLMSLIEEHGEENVANAFADSINQAIAERTKSSKEQDAEELMDTIYDFLNKWYPELDADSVPRMNADEFIAVLDLMMEEITAMKKLADRMKSRTKTVKVEDAEDILSAFFKANSI